MKTKARFEVIFEGGQARNTEGSSRIDAGCNYMLCVAINRDGEEVELYAEYLEPDYSDFEDFECNEDYYSQFLEDGWTLERLTECFPDGEGLDLEQFLDTDKFDEVSYSELKSEILKQAEEYNVDSASLVFLVKGR